MTSKNFQTPSHIVKGNAIAVAPDGLVLSTVCRLKNKMFYKSGNLICKNSNFENIIAQKILTISYGIFELFSVQWASNTYFRLGATR